MMAAELISRRSTVSMGGSDVRHSVLISSQIAEEAYCQDTHGFREDVRLGSFR